MFKNQSKDIFAQLLIFGLIIYWIFSGFPQIWHNPPVPPEIQKAQAAFSSPTARGSTVRTTSGTTIAVTPTANVTVGKIAFLGCVTDNTATANGASANHDSVADTDGHTWAEVFEETDSDTAAADGSTISLWWTKVTTQIDTTDAVTLTIDTARTDGVCGLVEVTIGAGKTVTAITLTPTHSDTHTMLSATSTGLTSQEYLFFGLFGAEGEDTAKTAIANYSELHDLVSTTSGSADANVQLHIGTRIRTDTGDTWTSSAVTFTNGIQSLTMFYEVASEAPTITVNQPDGVSDLIAPGANYTVNYDLADAGDTVTANFAYDADASGYNGNLIAGCINQVEGTGATCTWNTTGVPSGTYYVHGTTTDGTTAAQDYSSSVVTINAAPTIEVTQPDGADDTVTVGDNYTIYYTLTDSDDTVTANFAYDGDAADYNGNLIAGCINKAEAAGGTGTCIWNTTGVTPGNYYIHGTSTDSINTEAQDYSSGVVTIQSAFTGVFNITASSSESFNSGVAIPFQFYSQTTTVAASGALKIEDDRGSNLGWDVYLGATDWKSGQDVMQLDYDGTGTDDNLGKLCAFPSAAAISAETGSITGVTVGSADACFSAGITNIAVASATAGNGNGAYWLTDMTLEQFIPFSPTAQVYTTTIYYTLISK